jgi:aminoglycoside phosphotransferase (APT) family kinase protein
MPTWTAEIEVDEGVVRRLLATQFPELRLASVEPLADGWDSSVYVVDEEWAFRFPRRAVVLPGLAAELAVLPRLAPRLPVEIPVSVYIGTPANGFPWPFAGARLIPGREATAARRRDALAAALGRALRALHDPSTLGVAGDLREDANRRADTRLRVPHTRGRLAELAAGGLWEIPAPVDAILDEAFELPPPRPTAVCHGDLHFRHLIVGDGELRGLIDWIDVCCSDPAIDLQLLWSFFTPDERDAFLGEYGPVSRHTLVRARVVALFLNAALALYGAAEGHEAVTQEALEGLDRTLLD